MEELLFSHTEQNRLFARIETEITKGTALWQIIQTTLEDGRELLQSDRLLIYQLDVSADYSTNSQLSQPIDVVTYEAKSRDDILSSLYFQERDCSRNLSECRHKYHQGFSLVLDDIERYNLPDCLRSLMQKMQVRAEVVVPINVRGKLWGLAIAHQCFVPRQWHSDEIGFLRRLSEKIAMAIEHDCSYQKLKQQKEFLEQQVKIQARQIRNALISAQTAARSKHEFLGSMSHELRTPLTRVMGLSSTLLQSSLSKDRITLPLEKQQQYLKIIHESGKNLLTIIDNILDFSEVESGNYLLNIEQISLGDLAHEVLQKVRFEAQEKQIALELELKIKDERYSFKGDREKLAEILLNLVGNAIKFTNSGGKVTVRIWYESERAVFQVEDTGIGIAKKEIPLLFEKFKQLEDFRRRTHGGTGLGLALTKQLIELHSGTIEVRSTIGKGAIFTVYLPERNLPQPNIKKSQFIGRLGNEVDNVVLIVENEDNATFISQLLTAIGYKVVLSVDSSIDINRIELLEPTIIIVDKKSSAIATNLSQKNKQKPNNGRVKILLWCSQISASEWQYFSKNGVDDYLLETTNSLQIIKKLKDLGQSDL
ncbi:GAF domain-containing sensor histidine kinase, partial [Myxosarcina sp. GI1]|uniref:sensor histidine kinase n=1 Tax=Myxosarcina sp. GI1 TaxID=1541065 RepID=UPI00055AABAC